MWIKLDDAWLDHPKLIQAGLAGRALWLAGLTYCCGQLTDGLIHCRALPLLAAKAGIGEATGEPNAEAVASHLVELELWEIDSGGWRVHDYGQWQRSAQEVASLREARKAAGQKGGRRSGQVRAAVAKASKQTKHEATASPNGQANREPETNPVPVPVDKNSFALSSETAAPRPGPKAGDKPRQNRPPDPLFEAVCEATGIDWHELTSIARGSANKAVAELRGVGATPDEVRARAGRWPYDTRLTPPALAKHWPQLAAGRRVNGHAPPTVHTAATPPAADDLAAAAERVAAIRHARKAETA